eukprot:236202-Prymnesium_polylepis.1
MRRCGWVVGRFGRMAAHRRFLGVCALGHKSGGSLLRVVVSPIPKIRGGLVILKSYNRQI